MGSCCRLWGRVAEHPSLSLALPALQPSVFTDLVVLDDAAEADWRISSVECQMFLSFLRTPCIHLLDLDQTGLNCLMEYNGVMLAPCRQYARVARHNPAISRHVVLMFGWHLR